MGRRVVIYSHDTLGLGHLRRSRVIAHALVEAYPHVSVLIVSGSPLAASFELKTRVDVVRMPGIVKKENGSYRPASLSSDLATMLALRAALLERTIEAFAPDLLIVDKEPRGLKGELEPALARARARGTMCVLGLRDILDAPPLVRREWARKRGAEAVARYYDGVWVYGLKAFHDPLPALGLAAADLRKVTFTGYLERALPRPERPPRTRGRLLVMTGGGADGAGLIDWVLSAAETAGRPLPPLRLVLGPFMPNEAREGFQERARGLAGVEIATFDDEIEWSEAHAGGIVSMAGYNSFCEILSFDKPALLVPRLRPRREQLLRATRAAELGLARMLEPRADRDRASADAMAEALAGLPDAPHPSARAPQGMLAGLAAVVALAGPALRVRRAAPRTA